MASPLGEATVLLKDGRTLTLQFDYEAFVRAEKSVPDARLSDLLPMPKSKDEEQRPPTMEAMRAMCFGALYLHHPDMGQTELGNLMLPNLPAFADAMNKGMIEAFGAPSADSEEEAGTGSAEGPPKTRSIGTPCKKPGRR
jgi:hypothetical protein